MGSATDIPGMRAGVWGKQVLGRTQGFDWAIVLHGVIKNCIHVEIPVSEFTN
jgi:hypothetical protein